MADGNVHTPTGFLAPSPPSTIVGELTAHDEAGLWVDFPGNSAGPVLARVALEIGAATVAEAITSRRGVLLVFERDERSLPIIMGLLHEPAAPCNPAPVAAPAVARVDGKRIVIEGQDEIVLRCGRASITLRRNGRVVIRGIEVETRASGVNRIRGGSVAIN